MTTDQLLSCTEAARIVGISPNTLRYYASKGRCPAARKIGPNYVFSEAELRAWDRAASKKKAGRPKK